MEQVSTLFSVALGASFSVPNEDRTFTRTALVAPSMWMLLLLDLTPWNSTCKGASRS
jgi:hypothetical protein